MRANAPQLKTIDGRTWIYLIAAGILTTISSLFTFRALKLGDASQASPLGKSIVGVCHFICCLVFKRKLTPQIIVGALLITAGGLLIAFAKKTS